MPKVTKAELSFLYGTRRPVCKFGQNSSIPSWQAIFQNLNPHENLKMGWRSSKLNQFLSLSQQYSCASLVKIYPFIQEIGCIYAISQQSEPSCDLENGVKVTKI